MKKTIDPSASTSQTEFLSKFDRDSVKEEKLVDLIVKQIPNVKYLRGRIFASTEVDADTKKIALGHVENILFNLAALAWEKSRWVPKYKYEHLTHFLDMTLDGRVLNCTIVITKEEVQEAVNNVSEQTCAPLRGQAAVLKHEFRRVETIIANFKTLKFLFQ